jgi:hypothetical protein
MLRDGRMTGSVQLRRSARLRSEWPLRAGSAIWVPKSERQLRPQLSHSLVLAENPLLAEAAIEAERNARKQIDL